MKRRIVKLAALGLALAFLTGCVGLPGLDMAAEEPEQPEATQPPLTEPMYTDREALYQYYTQVNIGDMKDDLIARYGEPAVETTDNGDTYVWAMDDGYGFAAVFFDSGRLRAKALYYKDIRQLGRLSAASSIENFSNLSSSYTFEMTCGLLGGRAMEIMQIAQDSSAEPEVKRVFAWATEKGDCVQVLFKGDESLESVSYSMAD